MRCFIAAASFFATVFFIGCGAPTGTGLDFKSSVNTNKILQVEEVLAVDDILVNSTLNIGTGIENGVITGFLMSVLWLPMLKVRLVLFRFLLVHRRVICSFRYLVVKMDLGDRI